jgi:hypothetical protein
VYNTNDVMGEAGSAPNPACRDVGRDGQKLCADGPSEGTKKQARRPTHLLE